MERIKFDVFDSTLKDGTYDIRIADQEYRAVDAGLAAIVNMLFFIDDNLCTLEETLSSATSNLAMIRRSMTDEI